VPDVVGRVVEAGGPAALVRMIVSPSRPVMEAAARALKHLTDSSASAAMDILPVGHIPITIAGDSHRPPMHCAPPLWGGACAAHRPTSCRRWWSG